MHFFYPHVGGVERHVYEISKKIIRLGYKVEVITEQQNPETLESDHDGIRIFRIPIRASGKMEKFWVWLWLFKNRKLLENADIIHAHDVAFWYFPFKFLYPTKHFFVTFHGYEGYPPTRKAIIVRKMSEKLAQGNICIGDYISKWYGTRADFISYGAVSETKVGTSNNSVNAVFIGRLDDQTGIMTYIKTVKKLKETGIKFKLIVCGDGPLRNEVEEFVLENKLDVQSLGFTISPEKYLARTRFAFVSRYLAILEAMAAKKLVFATYDNPLKEDYLRMAPFAKWIVIQPTAEALYSRLTYYTQHPEEEKEMVEAAYNWVKEQTWDKMTDIYLKLWGIKP